VEDWREQAGEPNKPALQRYALPAVILTGVVALLIGWLLAQ
jgi:hypothetical protein